MVKNNIGGNKSKKFANKTFNISDRATRFAKEQGEIYAYVEKLMGNNMCHVMCIDGYLRTCVIRGKFLGKGKRDSVLSKGKWVLVGLRDWENNNKGTQKEKCDLLEVYSDNDKQRLQNDNTVDFTGFLKNDNIENENYDDYIKFTNQTQDSSYLSLFDTKDPDNLEDDQADSNLEDDQADSNLEDDHVDSNLDSIENKNFTNTDVNTINDLLNKIDIDDI